MFASAANREREELRAELSNALRQKNQQVELLRRQLSGLSEKMKADATSANQAQLETETLKGLIAQLEAQAQENEAKLLDLQSVCKRISKVPRRRLPS